MKKILPFLLILFVLLSCQEALSQNNRFMNHTEIGVLAYSVRMKEAGMTFHTFNGYELNPDFAIGGTVGYDRYLSENTFRYGVIPVSVGLRYNYRSPETTRLIAGLDAGYGFAWDETDKSNINQYNKDNKIKGGLRFNPEVGILFRKNENSAFFTITVGYQFQHLAGAYTLMGISPPPNSDYLIGYPTSIENYSSTVKSDLHRLTLKVGFGF